MQRGPSCNGTPIENTFIMSVRNTKRYILEMFMMYVNFLFKLFFVIWENLKSIRIYYNIY